MRKKIFWLIIVIGVFGVFYLSWLPQPRLENYWFMPKFIGKWADAGGNENLRTAVPFLFIGGFLGLWLVNKNKAFKNWILAWLFNVFVVSIAEVGQLFLSNRTCDFGDVIWGAAGAFVGLVFIFLGNFVIASIKVVFNALKKPVFYEQRNTQYI